MDHFDNDATTEFMVTCPYCGEQVVIYLEPDVMGTLIQDCEVCCRPWQVHVSRDQEYRYVDVTRGDGSE
jgi:Cysteine-rich CPXCG